VEYTFADGVKMFAQTRQIAGCWDHSTVEIYGPKGKADLDRGRIEGQTPWRLRGAVPNPYQVEHDLFVEAIPRGTPYNEVDYAATATLAGIMGRMACYSGQMITWEQIVNSKMSLSPKEYALDATPPVMPDATGRYPVAMPGITKVF
jgi:myo-inositol 2-dehydrogenase / D-chiro-inositol 1-dehydrogenase